MRHEFSPDIVLFIPAGQPPHKDIRGVTPAEHRYRMTLLATADNPCFEVSPLEMDRTGPSYTIDTVRVLREQYKNAEILFITGADAIEQILTWKDADKLLGLCRFIAVTRPGWAKTPVIERYAGRLHVLDMPAVAISGTGIRERAACGKPIRYLLPSAVEAYVRENGLYTGKPFAFDYEMTSRLLSERLSPERYLHTLGVADEAGKLAARYNADIEKARTAGLLHDCAKEYTREKKRALCALYGIALDEVTDRQIDLTHSVLSAETARREYGVNDPGIYQAIRFHTTGHEKMTLLDKIIMLADFIEPNREDYPGLEKMRARAYKDINAALLTGVEHVIAFNEKRGRLIHPDGLDALKYLRKIRTND